MWWREWRGSRRGSGVQTTIDYSNDAMVLELHTYRIFIRDNNRKQETGKEIIECIRICQKPASDSHLGIIPNNDIESKDVATLELHIRGE
jgi:hypothetical protein